MSAIDRKLLDELREILGDGGIVSRATELKVYECDGWTVEKSVPDVLLLPRTTTQVSAVLAALASPRDCFRSARRGHRPFRRMPSAERARDDLHFEDESDRRNRSRQSARRGRERRRQPARHQRGQVERIFLRARSVVAGRMHDRRQHRREFRRSAYLEIRRDHQSRARARARSARRRSRRARRIRPKSDAATIWSAPSSARRARRESSRAQRSN